MSNFIPASRRAELRGMVPGFRGSGENGDEGRPVWPETKWGYAGVVAVAMAMGNHTTKRQMVNNQQMDEAYNGARYVV